MFKTTLRAAFYIIALMAIPSMAFSMDTPVYELRIYHTHEGKLGALHQRFIDHTMDLFEKHGMTNVGYWTAADGSQDTLTFLLSYPDFEARERSWAAFSADSEWQAVYAASHVDGPLVERVDSRLLRTTDYSPSLSKALEELDRGWLYELRVYTTEEDRLDHLDARFRDHTMNLFAKHGMINLIYFHLAEGMADSEKTLIYFLAHKDEAAHAASFSAFGKDPDWVAARRASEEKAGGSLTAQGGVKSYLLRPTSYSPIQ